MSAGAVAIQLHGGVMSQCCECGAKPANGGIRGVVVVKKRMTVSMG